MPKKLSAKATTFTPINPVSAPISIAAPASVAVPVSSDTTSVSVQEAIINVPAVTDQMNLPSVSVSSGINISQRLREYTEEELKEKIFQILKINLTARYPGIALYCTEMNRLIDDTLFPFLDSLQFGSLIENVDTVLIILSRYIIPQKYSRNEMVSNNKKLYFSILTKILPLMYRDLKPEAITNEENEKLLMIVIEEECKLNDSNGNFVLGNLLESIRRAQQFHINELSQAAQQHENMRAQEQAAILASLTHTTTSDKITDDLHLTDQVDLDEAATFKQDEALRKSDQPVDIPSHPQLHDQTLPLTAENLQRIHGGLLQVAPSTPSDVASETPSTIEQAIQELQKTTSLKISSKFKADVVYQQLDTQSVASGYTDFPEPETPFCLSETRAPSPIVVPVVQTALSSSSEAVTVPIIVKKLNYSPTPTVEDVQTKPADTWLQNGYPIGDITKYTAGNVVIWKNKNEYSLADQLNPTKIVHGMITQNPVKYVHFIYGEFSSNGENLAEAIEDALLISQFNGKVPTLCIPHPNLQFGYCPHWVFFRVELSKLKSIPHKLFSNENVIQNIPTAASFYESTTEHDLQSWHAAWVSCARMLPDSPGPEFFDKKKFLSLSAKDLPALPTIMRAQRDKLLREMDTQGKTAQATSKPKPLNVRHPKVVKPVMIAAPNPQVIAHPAMPIMRVPQHHVTVQPGIIQPQMVTQQQYLLPPTQQQPLLMQQQGNYHPTQFGTFFSSRGNVTVGPKPLNIHNQKPR